MRYNKLKAFTLAEIMVLLLTLSILMAAFAPVFTRRFNNVTSDEVWTYIAGDDNYNAYYDAPNKLFLNTAFIGLTPISTDEVKSFTSSGTCERCITMSGIIPGGNTTNCFEVACGTPNAIPKPAYSKLVIAASKKLGNITNDPPQNQMQFRMSTTKNDAAGALVGSLFAGNGNMLLGGPYIDIKDTAAGNTSYGLAALQDIKEGKGNTAVGTYALSKVTSGLANTAIGYNAGKSITSGSGNTFVGTLAGTKAGSAVGYNTMFGYKAGYEVNGKGNTVVGNDALSAKSGDGNTAIGNNALELATGKYNTAVGVNALSKMEKGNYNTAIGADSCNFIEGRQVSKITCIGAGSGASDKTSTTGTAGIPTGTGDNYDVPDRVFIGKLPDNTTLTSNRQKPMAIVEVHNSTNAPATGSNHLSPFPGGEESVIINANLVVRGQTYLEALVYRAVNVTADNKYAYESGPKGLMLFKTFKNYHSKINIFAGYDGSDRSGSSKAHCRRCNTVPISDVRPDCICTAVGPGYVGYTNYDTRVKNGSTYRHSTTPRFSSTSYDWYSKTLNSNGIEFKDLPTNSGKTYTPSCSADEVGTDGQRYQKFDGSHGNYYTDQSTNKKIYLARNLREDNIYKIQPADVMYDAIETSRPYAHMVGNVHSCCPNLSSDIRLKNVGAKFTAGLEEIKKINVYNYTYKNDKNKLPQVGVIAQDLKTVFPSAVFKDKNGYYTIRWDEMLYAAINAVKTLNSKIESLANKIATDKERIANLKRDNAQMYAQLDKLANELEILEAKKK